MSWNGLNSKFGCLDNYSKDWRKFKSGFQVTVKDLTLNMVNKTYDSQKIQKMIIYNHGGYILYAVITFKGLSTKNRSLPLALTQPAITYVQS